MKTTKFQSHVGTWQLVDNGYTVYGKHIGTGVKTAHYATIERLKNAIIRATRTQKQIQKDNSTR